MKGLDFINCQFHKKTQRRIKMDLKNQKILKMLNKLLKIKMRKLKKKIMINKH